jgi:hypothetical protein
MQNFAVKPSIVFQHQSSPAANRAMQYWISVSVCGLRKFPRIFLRDGMSLKSADRIWSALNGEGDVSMATFSVFLEFEL